MRVGEMYAMLKLQMVDCIAPANHSSGKRSSSRESIEQPAPVDYGLPQRGNHIFVILVFDR